MYVNDFEFDRDELIYMTAVGMIGTYGVVLVNELSNQVKTEHQIEVSIDELKRIFKKTKKRKIPITIKKQFVIIKFKNTNIYNIDIKKVLSSQSNYPRKKVDVFAYLDDDMLGEVEIADMMIDVVQKHFMDSDRNEMYEEIVLTMILMCKFNYSFKDMVSWYFKGMGTAPINDKDNESIYLAGLQAFYLNIGRFDLNGNSLRDVSDDRDNKRYDLERINHIVRFIYN